MLLSSGGRGPSCRLLPVLVAGLGLLAAGCASSSNTQSRTYAQVGMTTYERLGKKPEIEDDGLPAQIPPVRRNRTEPDNPREPFSPNYGKVSFAPEGSASDFLVVKPVVRLDEDAVIRQAILAHEQRYR